QDMLPLARLAQFVFRAPPDDLDAMLDEELEHRHESELARLPVDDRQHDDAEADLQLRMLIKVIQDDFGLLAALQLDHDAGAVAVAFIADVADAFDLLLVHQRGHLLDQPRLVDLVRDLADDDRLAVLADLLARRLGADLELAAALRVGVVDALP